MANDDFVNERIKEWTDAIVFAVDGKHMNNLQYILRLFAKEVERETRHKAAEMAMELHNKIMNL